MSLSGLSASGSGRRSSRNGSIGNLSGQAAVTQAQDVIKGSYVVILQPTYKPAELFASILRGFVPTFVYGTIFIGFAVDRVPEAIANELRLDPRVLKVVENRMVAALSKELLIETLQTRYTVVNRDTGEMYDVRELDGSAPYRYSILPYNMRVPPKARRLLGINERHTRVPSKAAKVMGHLAEVTTVSERDGPINAKAARMLGLQPMHKAASTGAMRESDMAWRDGPGRSGRTSLSNFNSNAGVTARSSMNRRSSTGDVSPRSNSNSQHGAAAATDSSGALTDEWGIPLVRVVEDHEDSQRNAHERNGSDASACMADESVRSSRNNSSARSNRLNSSSSIRNRRLSSSSRSAAAVSDVTVHAADAGAGGGGDAEMTDAPAAATAAAAAPTAAAPAAPAAPPAQAALTTTAVPATAAVAAAAAPPATVLKQVPDKAQRLLGLDGPLPPPPTSQQLARGESGRSTHGVSSSSTITAAAEPAALWRKHSKDKMRRNSQGGARR